MVAERLAARLVGLAGGATEGAGFVSVVDASGAGVSGVDLAVGVGGAGAILSDLGTSTLSAGALVTRRTDVIIFTRD